MKFENFSVKTLFLMLYQPVLTSWPAAYLWCEVVPKFKDEWWNGPCLLTALALAATSLGLWIKCFETLSKKID